MADRIKQGVAEVAAPLLDEAIGSMCPVCIVRKSVKMLPLALFRSFECILSTAEVFLHLFSNVLCDTASYRMRFVLMFEIARNSTIAGNSRAASRGAAHIQSHGASLRGKHMNEDVL